MKTGPLHYLIQLVVSLNERKFGHMYVSTQRRDHVRTVVSEKVAVGRPSREASEGTSPHDALSLDFQSPEL